MNEKSLSVLEQYDFDVYKTSRDRGGIILNTNQGLKLLYECNKAEAHYEHEDKITQALLQTGFINIDTYCRNKEGKLIAISEENRKYIVKDWFDGRECDIMNLGDSCGAVRTLAQLHINLNTMSSSNEEIMSSVEFTSNVTDFNLQFFKRTKELKMVNNYLRNKKKRTEFERIARDNFNIFYEEALRAGKMIEGLNYSERLENAKKTSELCHGNYSYHNVLFSSRCIAVTNFDKCKINSQISDLYQFMRKLLEKNNWDIKLAYKMIEEYDNIKSISDIDLQLLAVLFAYPEKFWKIINYYFNSNKSWIPRKSIEKLEMVISQNPLRQKFVDTIA